MLKDINEENVLTVQGQMKNRVIEALKLKDDPNHIIPEFNKLFEENNKNKNSKNKDKLNEMLVKASMALGLDTHIPILYAIPKDYRSLAIEFANRLNEEFKVKEASEKAIVQTIVTAYIRYMVLSQKLTSLLEVNKISENTNTFYAHLSKDLDRAQRQFISVFTLLKELKSPSININVKTNNAFIAQNQHLNNPPYEINTP